jgi:hypothetical protein
MILTLRHVQQERLRVAAKEFGGKQRRCRLEQARVRADSEASVYGKNYR